LYVLHVGNVHAPVASFQRWFALDKSMRIWFNGCFAGQVASASLQPRATLLRTLCGRCIRRALLRLVFVLLGTNLEHDYLSLLNVFESERGSPACAARSQQLLHSVVWEKVHAFLCAAECVALFY